MRLGLSNSWWPSKRSVAGEGGRAQHDLHVLPSPALTPAPQEKASAGALIADADARIEGLKLEILCVGRVAARTLRGLMSGSAGPHAGRWRPKSSGQGSRETNGSRNTERA